MTSRRQVRSRPSPEARIRRAAEAWFITDPLLFGAFLVHKLVPRADIASVRSGEGRIEYNPDFIAALPDRTLQELLRLEAVRIVLKHPYTRKPASAEIAWQASNITLREHLPETRLPLPSAREVFGDDALSKQYFELYCDRLVEKTRGSFHGEARGASKAEGGSGEATAEEQVQRHFAPSQGLESAEPWREDSLVREQIDDVIREIQSSSTWGSLPGSLVSHILATLRPRLDYRAILRAFRTSILSSRRELTRMKPSRRYGFLYMGSRHRLRTRLLCAVDVSGSVGDDDLAKAFSAINRLFKYGIESIDVVEFDTELTGPVVTIGKRQPHFKVTGRGGTSFAPVLAYIDEHDKYDGLIIVTDGFAPRPEPPKNRRTQVLWLFHHEATYQQMHASLEHVGRTAFIKPDPEAGHRSRRRR